MAKSCRKRTRFDIRIYDECEFLGRGQEMEIKREKIKLGRRRGGIRRRKEYLRKEESERRKKRMGGREDGIRVDSWGEEGVIVCKVANGQFAVIGEKKR